MRASGVSIAAEYGVFFTGPAAARLYDDHVDAVHRYVARRLGPEAAVEVVAATFSVAVHSDGPPGSTAELERGWLLGIATRLLHEHDLAERTRLAAWQHRAPGTADPLDPLVTMNGHEDEVNQVMRAAADLALEDRDLLFLVIWERYPHTTVARALGIPTGAVSSELKRVRRELRRQVSRQAEHPDASGRVS
jgi:DNA-directed RNA polymerase specialized sigma24 family protein